MRRVGCSLNILATYTYLPTHVCFLHSQKDFANEEKEKVITNEDDSKEIEEVSKMVSQKDSKKVCFQQKKRGNNIVLDPAKVCMVRLMFRMCIICDLIWENLACCYFRENRDKAMYL